MKLDATTLRTVGEALFGPLWQSPMARDLDVSDRTVRRWAAGEFDIPDGVWAELAELCKKRGKELRKLSTALRS